MGYFLPETESGAVQRWWAEPEGAGAERQLLITAMQECTSFPTEKPCWVRVMPGSLAVSSLMNTCNDSWGGKPVGMPSFWGVRRKTWRAPELSNGAGCACSSYCLLQLLCHLWTYRWTPQKCWNNQNHSCTVQWHMWLFLASQTGTPKCHVPRLRLYLGKDPVWETCM